MIDFPLHAREQMEERSVTQSEVRQVIERGRATDARAPRLTREMVFTEGYRWKERSYPHKSVKVIYASDRNVIVVVTVYVLYGRWETDR